MRTFFLICIVALLSINLSGQTISKPNPKTNAPILFVVDASGSMSEIFSGVPRMVAARVMLFEQLLKIDPKTPVGLVAYGNRIPGCRSHRIYAPIRVRNRRSLQTQIKKLYPAGATPIANTLRLIGTRLLPYYPGTTVIIISDGAESCGGDPVREAQKLMRKGYNVKLNVIGLSVDRITAIQLGAIARVGKGQYFDVTNQASFADAINQSTRVTNNPEITETIKPQPVVQSNAMLEITKVYQQQNEKGQMTWHIKYKFKTNRPGRYLVHIKALSNPVIAGQGGQIPADDRLFTSRSDAYYQQKAGKGEMEIPISSIQLQNQKNKPVFFQAELWDVSSIPVHLYTSTSMLAK